MDTTYFRAYACFCCSYAWNYAEECDHLDTSHGVGLAMIFPEPGETIIVETTPDNDAPNVFECVGCGDDSMSPAYSVTSLR